MNHKDYQFKIQNWGRDAKIISGSNRTFRRRRRRRRRRRKVIVRAFLSDCVNYWTLNFEHKVNLVVTLVFLTFMHNYKHDYIPSLPITNLIQRLVKHWYYSWSLHYSIAINRSILKLVVTFASPEFIMLNMLCWENKQSMISNRIRIIHDPTQLTDAPE